MKLTWYGQASFGIVSNSDTTVVTDPYDPETSGFKPFPKAADVVIMSSDNDEFHCNEHLVPKKADAVVINALTLARSRRPVVHHGTTFRAIEAMEHLQHDKHDPDQNGMYRFVIDGIEIGHMGDMGNPFSDPQVDFFKGVDVLLSLAGGFPVIDLGELKRVVDLVKPSYVVPMHFRTLCYKPQEMHFITEFLTLFPKDEVDFASSSSTIINKDKLPLSTRALVLDNY